MKTPNYVTIQDYKYTDLADRWIKKDILAGTFVRPISMRWLPSHILNGPAISFFDPETEIFVYMSLGIIIIPKTLIRKVS